LTQEHVFWGEPVHISFFSNFSWSKGVELAILGSAVEYFTTEPNPLANYIGLPVPGLLRIMDWVAGLYAIYGLDDVIRYRRAYAHEV